MEIAENVYEGVVTPSYKKITRAESNRTGHSIKKIGEAASSNTHPATDGIAGKRRKRCVDHSKSESKTCITHGVGNSSVECKVLG